MVLVHMHLISKANAKTSYRIALFPKKETENTEGETLSIFLFSSWEKSFLRMSVIKCRGYDLAS